MQSRPEPLQMKELMWNKSRDECHSVFLSNTVKYFYSLLDLNSDE